MDKLKDLLHELRCDMAAIPKNEENITEIENAQETLNKAWTELLRLYNAVGQNEQEICEYCNEDAKPTCCDACLEGMVCAVQKSN